MKTVQFDHYISLGRNCEPAFQFRRVLGKDHSGFFSWNVTPLDALASLLDSDFSGILKAENLVPATDSDLVLDQSHNFSFHWLASDNVEQHRQKAAHLAAKFREMTKSLDMKAMFLLTDDEIDVKKAALRVQSILYAKFAARNVQLVVLQPHSRFEGDWGLEWLSNRYLHRLAPWEDASDGHVKSWDAVFQEFPHRSPMRLAGFL